MNWTWCVIGVYGLIGISRFAWAMNRKATWRKNAQAQETILNLSGVALLVTLLFETFLWPVELAICFYLILKEKRSNRRSVANKLGCEACGHNHHIGSCGELVYRPIPGKHLALSARCPCSSLRVARANLPR